MNLPTSRPLLASLLILPLLAMAARAADYIVYAGTFTNTTSKGIYAYRFQTGAGKLTPLGLAAETPSPSFLVEQPNHRFLYAVNENGGSSGPSVSAFAMDAKTGKLTFLNKVPVRGSGPTHLALDKTNRWLAVANYGSGSVNVMPVHADGTLGEVAAFDQHQGPVANPVRQRGPHAHCALFSPDNGFLFVADLGLDRVYAYRFDAAKGAITPADSPFAKVAPGAGARHMAFHTNGRVLYVINEIGNTVTAFHYHSATGALDEIATVSTLPSEFAGTSNTAEIAVNRKGTVLYGSNRGHDSIAVFAIDPSKFTLSPVEYAPTLGKGPRNFALDPAGRYLIAANQTTDNIVVFRVDSKTGRLTPTGQVMTDAARPVCILFVPAK